MPVILLGSPLNPLSAVAARHFHERGELSLVVLPAGLPSAWSGGALHALSLVLVGLRRCLAIVLRRLGVRRGDHYLSLREFLHAHPEVPTRIIRPLQADWDALLREVEARDACVVSCIFPFKIPTRAPSAGRMVNIHPGLLPENRGPNPYFWSLALGHAESGITYHVLTERFDEGPILHKVPFPVSPSFSEHRLEAMTAAALEDSLPAFWERLEELWTQVRPQSGGRYYPEPTAEARRKHRRRSVFTACRDRCPGRVPQE